jgi:hypothetical protein
MIVHISSLRLASDYLLASKIYNLFDLCCAYPYWSPDPRLEMNNLKPCPPHPIPLATKHLVSSPWSKSPWTRRGLVNSLEMGSSISKKGLMRDELDFRGIVLLDISLLFLRLWRRDEKGTYLDVETLLVRGLMYFWIPEWLLQGYSSHEPISFFEPEKGTYPVWRHGNGPICSYPLILLLLGQCTPIRWSGCTNPDEECISKAS